MKKEYYSLYFLEEGKPRFYGQGDYFYIMELLHDYIRIHDIYGEDKIDFRIEKVINKIFSKDKFKNGLGIEFSNVEEFVDVIDKLMNVYNFKKEDFYFDLERECDYFSEMNNKLFEKKRIIFYDTDGSIDWHIWGWNGEERETISYEDFMKE